MNKTLQQSQKNLEELFDLFNKEFYNNELERKMLAQQLDCVKFSSQFRS